MQLLTKNLFGQKRHWPVISVLFFVASYLFLTLSVRAELIYYYCEVCRKTPIFKTGSIFLRDCLSYPGGFSQYLSAFFTQMCYFPRLGSLFIILIAWGLYRLSAALLDISADSICRVICFVPAILILMICGRYENPLSFSVALLIVMLISVLYQKISARMGWPRCVLFLIFSVTLYFLAGGAVLIFLVLAALFELFERRKLVFCVTYLLLGTAVCWFVGAFLFRMDTSESYLSFIPLMQIMQIFQQENLAKFLSFALLAFIPVAFLVINIIRMLLKKMSDSRLQMPGREKPSGIEEKTDDVPGWVIQVTLVVLIGVLCILFSYDLKVKRTLQVNYFTSRRMWPEALTIVRKGSLKKYFPYCNNAVNRALFHTGRMGNEMFTFLQTQTDSDLVFCKVQQGNVNYMERSDVCLDLGMVNAAEEVAYEFLADDNPYILKQLSLINLVKGQIESARVYLNALSRYPAYAGEATGMLRRLEKDPLLEQDERVQYLRKIMENNDITYITYDEENWLKELLRRNKNNKMAFEYLMAHYLLNCQLDKFVENLPRLDDFGYESIPRHYQEAILLYAGTTHKEVDLGARVIDGDVVDQYNKMNEIATDSSSKDLNVMRRILEPNFSKTYFFYFTFGYSK
ncbi:MAG: DUF6057 family protein [Sedimentisphaerales bacterium]